MHYVYVLVSAKDKKFYIGSTAKLRDRLAAHQASGVLSTKARRPLKLVFYEAYLSYKRRGS